MAQPKGSKTGVSLAPEQNGVDKPDNAVATDSNDDVVAADSMDEQAIDATFAALKTLLSTVEKVQKARQSVGDIKPLLIRLLDGEMLVDEELEQVKAGINGLAKLAKLYGDYQDALTEAQPARTLLDRMIKPQALNTQND